MLSPTVSNNSSIKLSPKWQFCSSTQPPSFINWDSNRRACTSWPWPMEMARQSVMDERIIEIWLQITAFDYAIAHRIHYLSSQWLSAQLLLKISAIYKLSYQLDKWKICRLRVQCMISVFCKTERLLRFLYKNIIKLEVTIDYRSAFVNRVERSPVSRPRCPW